MSDSHGWYEAFKAKDARFDGRFFVGVASTGIYCRPVCRAKLPKIENCTFYATAAAAEQAGFRPCLLCRPELAPGAAPVDAMRTLAQRAARLLEADCNRKRSVEEIALRLGCSDRHLRRAFTAEYHVTPIQYLQTCRLLLAKNLLTDTALPVGRIALSAGFGSLRRFNDLFQKHYHLSPSALRKQAAGRNGQSVVTLGLGYRPPYRWEALLAFFAQRAIPGVELIKDGVYWRVVHMEQLHGWIRVADVPQKNLLEVTVDPVLLPVLPRILARVRHQFDLYCNPDVVYETLAPMNEIRPGACLPGTRLPGCFDAFEMSVRAVLGQQITVKGACTLAARVVEAYGTPVHTGIEGLTHAFPSPETILRLNPVGNSLGPLGITGARANTISALARMFVSGGSDVESCPDPEAEIRKFLTVPGIGAWTAQYIAMRALGWSDAFPHTDYGIKKALAPRTEKKILALAESWHPWRSYAAINLWNSL